MPWEVVGDYIRSGHRPVSDFDADSIRTIDIDEEKGIKAVVGCPRGQYRNGRCQVGMVVQSFLFPVDKFTLDEAKRWFDERQASNEGPQGFVRTNTRGSLKLQRKSNGLAFVEIRMLAEKVYEYENNDGSGVRHEFVPASEINRPEFLRSVSYLPITNDHPGGETMLNAENISQFICGLTLGNPRFEDGVVVNDGVLWDQKVIEEIERNGRDEVSLGYFADVVPASGSFNGQSYVAEHRNLVPNHVAVNIAAGRCGRECVIVPKSLLTEARSVAADANLIFGPGLGLRRGAQDAALSPTTREAGCGSGQQATKNGGKSKMDTIELAFGETKYELPKDLEAFRNAIKKHEEHVAFLKAEVARLQSGRSEEQCKLNARLQAAEDAVKLYKEKCAAFESRLQAIEQGTGLDAVVDERTELVRLASEIIPGYVHKGKSNVELMVEIVNTKVPGFAERVKNEKWTNDSIRTYFTAFSELNRAQAAAQLNAVGASREGAQTDLSERLARAREMARGRSSRIENKQ